MDKDKLITFLTSDDEEIRKVGLEIIKNNFNCDFLCIMVILKTVTNYTVYHTKI